MFKGSIVALITPMDIKGNICKKSLKKLVKYHIKNKTNAIISVGTTGESATLNKNEHTNVIMHTLEYADEKIPIIAGTGSNATSESILLTKKLELSGISGCLNITPYYNKPTQEGLYLHFKSISESTDLPQILYNVPHRTGCDLLPQTIAKLAKFKNIIGLKDASGDLSRVNQIKSLVNKNFILISGDDTTALDFIQLGGNGVISVTANIAARHISKICKLALAGNFYKARKINEKLKILHNLLFKETNPIPIKWAAKYIGLIETDKIRLPMTQLLDKNKKNLKKIINLLQLNKNKFL
ncbi:4-hydroxy-tetrahydrodipicolinate synthase [Buchnera aphidicola]|uniref:4-hydroxy-tetrahydrodipicolinate synthase n=1 Tax=Buchnera aphidicola subsp. Cinara cedri (strain Cc) TaxID=372461 RepID=DAPA_BUCCC|nr:4-hydroxy-tetrahydrodipicolinate synthase [Buchnera aphidicola]Q058B1.1 RecName: Full=4-hydroxy-tetrahydrodipicolinate synthase; Short=HTPA synthase [Buchnera aphidicola BCc]ABJ90538.1 dihydrodipicolinate synthase [Buchnera aphidicola BCc]